jgi:hypothetical protein
MIRFLIQIENHVRKHIPFFFNIKLALFFSVTILTLLFLVSASHSQDAGSRASFTRSGWVGARYVAMGKAAEVVVDDVFAIYWNPAGLSELKGKKTLSPEEIKKKAESGDIKGLTEEDLIKFSEEDESEVVFQAGVSAALLDINREAGFFGLAINLFDGVIGFGVYSIQSRDIESYDENGILLKKINYSASTGYLSYGWNYGISSIGFSLKGLYEKIGEIEYIGGGLDIGAQSEILPFLKVGFLIQDIGTGLKPREKYENIEDKYDLASASLRLSAAIINRTSDFILAVSGVKKLEQEEFELNMGLQYDVLKFVTIYVGLNDTYFSSGMSIRILGMDVSYAFNYDKINMGYNNIISVILEL